MFWFWDIVGSVQTDGSLVSSEPTGVLDLGHFGVEFRVTGAWLLTIH